MLRNIATLNTSFNGTRVGCQNLAFRQFFSTLVISEEFFTLGRIGIVARVGDFSGRKIPTVRLLVIR